MTRTETVSARVVGFAEGSPTTYTTEVTAAGDGGCSWTLGIRYSAFHRAYTRITDLDRAFAFDFPKKGGLFSSPSPHERQPQLDAFVQALVAHAAKRQDSDDIGSVVDELLEISQHAIVVGDAAAAQETTTKEPNCDVSAEPETEADVVTTASTIDSSDVPEAVAVEAAVTSELLIESEQDSKVAEEAAPAALEATEAAASVVQESTETSAPVVPMPHEEDTMEIVAPPVGSPTDDGPRDIDAAASSPLEPADAAVETSVTASDAHDAHESNVTSSQQARVLVEAPVVRPQSPTFNIAMGPVASTTTSTTSGGQLVVETKFANGMSLKKKSLTADQKKLRNLRRKEKRKKKSNMKIRGAKSHRTNDGTVTEESESEME